MHRGGVRPLLVTAAAFVIGGCYQERSRHIAGRYWLQQFELGDYSISRAWVAEPGAGGFFKGTVVRLGWNNRYVVAQRAGMSSAHPSGWMLIDVRHDRLDGPISDDELAMRMKSDPNLAGMVIQPAEDAWNALGWFGS